ncbi:acyltransferase family protein [Loigolactobacillus backii]|uniref:acyltransferase family protein n=1 Tax=Loigolactobacillus backii TaxID=375175 RepID=UPI003B8A7867
MELLRIIAMFCIVLSHFSLFGNWNKAGLTPITTTRLLLFDPLGPASALIFFIITGYFTYKSTATFQLSIRKELHKGLNIWLQTMFYSISILIIFLLTNHSVPLKIIAKAIFPFTLNEYWFVSAYWI